jgi:hypothetical protein
MVFEVFSRNLHVPINGFGVIASVIPSFGLLKSLLWRHFRIRVCISSHYFLYQMRGMLAGHSDSLLPIAEIQIHFNCKLGLSGIDVGRLSLAVLSFLDEPSCLINKNSISCLRFVLACHLQCGVEVSNILIHADCLKCFASFHKLRFCLFISLLVLKLEGML